ncbi:hypothetical protein ACROYT_G015464 [Oculina patagonica]
MRKFLRDQDIGDLPFPSTFCEHFDPIFSQMKNTSMDPLQDISSTVDLLSLSDGPVTSRIQHLLTEWISEIKLSFLIVMPVWNSVKLETATRRAREKAWGSPWNSIQQSASELKSQLQQELNRSKFYSSLFDGSTDSGTVEQQGVFVLYFDPDPESPFENSSTIHSMVKEKIQFLSLQNLKSASAEGVVDGGCSDPSVKAADRAKLSGYLRKWKTAKMFVYSCSFIDLLQFSATLSAGFQGTDIDAVAASAAMAKAKWQLTLLMKMKSEKMATMKHQLTKINQDAY